MQTSICLGKNWTIKSVSVPKHFWTSQLDLMRVMTRANFFNEVNCLLVSLSGVAFVRVLDTKSEFHIFDSIGQ